MSLVRSNRPRWSDYTRAAPANQLDDGTGDTLVLGPWNTVPALQAASPIELGLFLFVLNLSCHKKKPRNVSGRGKSATVPNTNRPIFARDASYWRTQMISVPGVQVWPLSRMFCGKLSEESI